MGVNPTPTNFKTFTFGGENSRSYGVYITGEGVFNAPERNVEMIEIPGRNGAFALDRGNFNNIEVTYPAGIFADTEADFAQAVSNLRSLLCSKVGYVRLEDDYNPNEYRMAIYKSGLDVDHDLLIAGEFDLTFECKPQRYLKSGETAISVTSGNTITNPTRFDAQPLIEAVGYGALLIGEKRLRVAQAGSLGKYVVARNTILYGENAFIIDPDYTNAYNSITIGGTTVNIAMTDLNDTDFVMWDESTSGTVVNAVAGNGVVSCEAVFAPFNFSAQNASTHIETLSFKLGAYNGGGTMDASQVDVTLTFSYASDGSLVLSASFTISSVAGYSQLSLNMIINNLYGMVETITVDSSKSLAALALYIDTETGEAYSVLGDVVINMNKYVTMGAELPTLASGANTITYDNTFTSFKVTARWWSV